MAIRIAGNLFEKLEDDELAVAELLLGTGRAETVEAIASAVKLSQGRVSRVLEGMAAHHPPLVTLNEEGLWFLNEAATHSIDYNRGEVRGYAEE
ncbi:MAG: hypothetical protein K1X67_15945 [Fimbriimonadaceae bacterium]|nr:hypothetical protein [Fimbriimonadaceae bacterium]